MIMIKRLPLRTLKIIKTLLDEECPTEEKILDEITRLGKISKEDIFGRARKPYIAAMRHAYMYIMHQKSALSLSEIGMKCGYRDHSTVLFAIDKINLWFKLYGKELEDTVEREKSYTWDVTPAPSEIENASSIMRTLYSELRAKVAPFKELDGIVVASNGAPNRTHYGFQLFQTDDNRGMLAIHYYLGENPEDGSIEDANAKIVGMNIKLHRAAPRIKETIDEIVRRNIL